MTSDTEAAGSAPAPAPVSSSPRGAASRRLISWGGLVLGLVLFVAVNVIAGGALRNLRIDLTEQRLYTLSEGTRTVLAGLKEPITLRFYYSRKIGQAIPAYGTYADRVRDMLQEYIALAGGRIRLETYDPEPFSEVEDRAVAFGMQGVPVDQSGEQVYFGLAGSNTVDDERVIAFFQPERERFLELDITRLIYELSNPRKPRLGVMTALPMNGEMRGMMGRPTPPWVVMTQLRQFFQVEDVQLDAAEIPANLDVLMVVQPQELADRTLYAIDQYVMGGGKLIVFVDPHSEAQAARPGPGGQPNMRTASSLDKLLNAWGVELVPDKVVGDLRGAVRVRAGATERVQAVDYVAWYQLQGDSLNRQDVVTGELNQIMVAAPGELRRREGAAIEFTPILQSSTGAAEIDAAKVRVDPSPTRILAEFRPSGTRYTIAARVRGQLASAFPDGPPPPPPAEGQQGQGQQGQAPQSPAPAQAPAQPSPAAAGQPAGTEGGQPAAPTRPHRARTEGPANLVVVADTDILEDRFWVRVQDFFGQQVATPVADNGAFVINLVDNLGGSDALISLRSRGESARPFEMVNDMRRTAEAQFRAKEQDLQKRLEETERRLRELRQGTGEQRGQNPVLSAEQRQAIEQARSTILETRRELRAVQRDLRREIERLESLLRFANIGLMPVLVGLLAIGLGVWRVRRRAHRSAA